MQKWKVILLVAAILVQSFYCPVMAREARFLETAAPVLDLSAKSAIVMEQESKEILFAKDKDKELAQRYPEVFKYTKIWMDTIIHKTKKVRKNLV